MIAKIIEDQMTHSKFQPLAHCWICEGGELEPVHQGIYDFSAYAEQDPEISEYTGDKFWLKRCRKCGFAQPDSTPTLPNYFDRMYDQRWSADWIEQEFESSAKDFIFQDALRYLDRRVADSERSLLDIGAHVGRFIHFADRAGWRAEGIELNPRTSEFAARKTGLPVHQVNAHELVSEGRKYNAVTMLDVLEHIPDPLKMLSRINELLDAGGWAAIKVPCGRNQLMKENLRARLNRNHKISIADNLVHINHFSPKSLKLALEKTGFTCIAIKIGAPELNPDAQFKYSKADLLRLGVYHLGRLVPGGAHTPLALNLQAYARKGD
jgi:2-polyprenyl-3-methyl-5-hydroxy-6-metoxy-1,4-benzoquinol methylase